MKLKMIMIGLLTLGSLSQGVLAAASVGSCPLLTDITDIVITSGTLKFEAVPQPAKFNKAYYDMGNKQMNCVYNTIHLSTPITGKNCSFSQSYSAAGCLAPNPDHPEKCILYCD